MSELRIITNHVPRDVIYAHELSGAEQSEFDYIDWTAVENGETSPEFFRYKGELYDLGDFLTTSELSKGAGHHDLSAWDGYASDSFFSGIVVKFVEDFERVVVGRYLA